MTLTPDTHVDVPMFIQLDPEWNHRPSDDVRALRGAKAARVTQRPPDPPKPGTVTVKVTIRIPKKAFLALQPEAVIIIPEDMYVVNEPIEAAVHDPRPDGDES